MSALARGTVVRHRYIRAGARVKGKLSHALRYMQQRPLGEDEQPTDRRLFTDRADGLSRHEARALIAEHSDRRVAYHRLILSPGLAVDDLQRWTRLVLADLSRHLGQEVRWVAVAHRNTAHPHVHVLIAGGGERLIEDGRSSQLILRPDAYAALRASGDRHARELARGEHDLDDAVRSELASLLVGFPYALGQELAYSGMQSHKHLVEPHPRRGAPGRDATPAR
jgi:hypothetical protein